MSYSIEEQRNVDAVQHALSAASTDFSRLSEVFVDDIHWTIAGHGPMARTFNGLKDLLENGENALFERISGSLEVTAKGVWADGDKVVVHMASAVKPLMVSRTRTNTCTSSR